MSTPQNSTAMEMEHRDVPGPAPALPFIKVPEDSPFKLAPPKYRQLAGHHHCSNHSNDSGRTSVYTIMPVNVSSSASKKQRERINEAVEEYTGKPEEIDHCRLGEKLIFAKASLTVDHPNMLQTHPDIAVVSHIPGPLIEYF